MSVGLKPQGLASYCFVAFPETLVKVSLWATMPWSVWELTTRVDSFGEDQGTRCLGHTNNIRNTFRRRAHENHLPLFGVINAHFFWEVTYTLV